jgi:hypothetical protein
MARTSTGSALSARRYEPAPFALSLSKGFRSFTLQGRAGLRQAQPERSPHRTQKMRAGIAAGSHFARSRSRAGEGLGLSEGGSGRGLSAPVGPLGSFQRPKASSGPLAVCPSRHRCLSAHSARSTSKRVPMLSLRGSVDLATPVFRRTYPGKWVRLSPRASSRSCPFRPLPPASTLADLRRFHGGPQLVPTVRFLPIFPSLVSDQADSLCRVAQRGFWGDPPVDNGDIVDKETVSAPCPRGLLRGARL